MIVSLFADLLSEHSISFFKSVFHFYEKFPKKTDSFDLLLLDLKNERSPDGIKTVEEISKLKSQIFPADIIVQSGVNDVNLMRQCIQNGALKYLLKENIAEELPLLLEQYIYIKSVKDKINHLIIGESEATKELKIKLSQLALQPNSVNILIEGETGSGKELCAQALHVGKGSFVAVNSSAIPRELFENEFFGSERGAYTGSTKTLNGFLAEAENGTLFLDEVQNISLEHQAKLLRVLESGEFHKVGSTKKELYKAKTISAANTDLKSLVCSQKFREDLYFRLATISVHVPPLRIRTGDIPILVNHFIKKLNLNKSFTLKAMNDLMKKYDWPGNIRELKNAVQSMCIDSAIPVIDRADVEKWIDKRDRIWEQRTETKHQNSTQKNEFNWKKSFDENVNQYEKELLHQAINLYSTTKARNILNLSRSRFYEKIKKYELMKKIKKDESK